MTYKFVVTFAPDFEHPEVAQKAVVWLQIEILVALLCENAKKKKVAVARRIRKEGQLKISRRRGDRKKDEPLLSNCRYSRGGTEREISLLKSRKLLPKLQSRT